MTKKCCEKCIGLILEHKCFGPKPDCHQPDNGLEEPKSMEELLWEFNETLELWQANPTSDEHTEKIGKLFIKAYEKGKEAGYLDFTVTIQDNPDLNSLNK